MKIEPFALEAPIYLSQVKKKSKFQASKDYGDMG
jgi:hypothetical protein